MAILPHEEAERRISQATVALICNHPFFATLLLRLRRRADPTAASMWTDGTELGFNPEYVLGLARDELVGALAHEVMHVAGLHPWRRGDRDNGAWNYACDQVVNGIVIDAGLVLPTGLVEPVRGKSAEELYVTPPPPPPPPAPRDGAGRGNSGSGGAGAQEGRSGPDDQRRPQHSSDPGIPDQTPQSLGCGEVRDPRAPDASTLSPVERAKQIDEVKIAVRQAMNAGRRAGNLPAGLERFAEEALEPQVPWREVLARFIDDQSRHDYSWSRPNRRFAGTGVILPSLWSPAFGRIVMGCDTSGSISRDQLRDVCGEILGAMAAYQERGQNPTLTVAWFDESVYPQTVEEPEELKPRGGGGTSFKAVFDWLSREDELPRAIVMVTDGHCSKFGVDPGIPVLWVLTKKNRSFCPPFGEVAFTL